MKTFKVYLAGPIGGLSYDEATEGWRAYATALLSDMSPALVPYSPMRFKSALKDELNLDATRYETTLTTPQAIVARDTYDVRSSDLILVNLLESKKVSIGTCCEIGMAIALQKPIVIARSTDCNIHYGPFITGCTPFHTETIEHAVEVTAQILLNK